MSFLSPEYTYIAFDFETTGLDVQKDEPIQIGIVEFDIEGKIISEFSSLIKPQKSIKELKSIVTYLTGFALDDLEDAPSIADVIPQISHYFHEKTIVVGQNVQFDISILQKYLQRTPAGQIDTYPLAKSILHFQSSYALDVIAQVISKNEENNVDDHHDALHDSKASLEVFVYRLERMTKLRRTYMLLDSLLQKNEGIFKKIIRRTEKNFSYENKKLFFPGLKKHHGTPKRLISEFKRDHGEKTGSRWYVGNHPLSSLLQGVDLQKHSYIITCTHKAKCQLVEQSLQKLGMSYGNFYDAIIFDPDRVNAFLQQETIDDDEFLFTLKYYSQFEAGHALLDINSSEDAKIFSTLTTYAPSSTAKIIVCTHQQLRENADKISSDQHVLFLDYDWRYQSFGRWAQQPFNPHTCMQIIEKLQYEAKLLNTPEKKQALDIFADQFTLSFGILSSEVDHLFKGVASNKIEIEDLLHHTRLPKTAQTFMNLFARFAELSPHLTGELGKKLEENIDRCRQLTENPCIIQKQMYHGNKRYYTLQETATYRGIEEMIEASGMGIMHFLSTTKKDYHPPKGLPSRRLNVGLTVHTERKPHIILKYLSERKNFQYVLSASKEASRTLFNLCVEKKLHETYTILGENITGGVGKNLFLAQQSDKPCIFIGGYAFYLQALAKKFAFSDLYLYHIFGPMKEQICTDMLRYSDRS